MTAECKRSYSLLGPVVALSMALLGLACSDGSRPRLPTAASRPAPPTTAPPGPSIAILTVPEFTARIVATPPTSRDYRYALRLVLAETGGRSAAFVGPPLVVYPGGDSEAGCTYGPRVPAGATSEWQINPLTDAPDYCAPDLATLYEAAAVTVIVRYTDEAGRTGSVTTTATVTR